MDANCRKKPSGKGGDVLQLFGSPCTSFRFPLHLLDFFSGAFCISFLVPPLHQLNSTSETYFCSSLIFNHLNLFIKCETRIIALHSPIKFGTGARKDWAQRTILFSFPQIKNLDSVPIVISSYMMLVYQYFYCNKDLII